MIVFTVLGLIVAGWFALALVALILFAIAACI